MGRVMKLIAELCQNHNGKMPIVKKMVELAAKSGADICKIQTIKARDLIYWKEFEDFRPYEKEYERLKSLELSIDDERKFFDYCIENGVKPMTTIFNGRDFDRFNQVGYDDLKISGYSVEKVLQYIESFNFRRLYISTSSLSLEQIKRTKMILDSKNITDYTFLNCTCVYPTPLDKLNLQNIDFLRNELEIKKVGFSDHSNPYEDNLLSSKLAIYQGIDTLERHFTILKPEDTRDGKVSITPNMVGELKRFSKLTKAQQYEELNEFNETQKFNHNYYRNRF